MIINNQPWTISVAVGLSWASECIRLFCLTLYCGMSSMVDLALNVVTTQLRWWLVLHCVWVCTGRGVGWSENERGRDAYKFTYIKCSFLSWASVSRKSYIYMNNCEQRFISSDYLIPCTTGLEAVKPEASGSSTSTLNRHRHLNLYSCP